MRQALLAVALAAASAGPPAPERESVRSRSVPEIAGARLEAARFADLPGWDDDAHAEAFLAFRRSCSRKIRTEPDPGLAEDLEAACTLAESIAILSDAGARAFFERNFEPWRILPEAAKDDGKKEADKPAVVEAASGDGARSPDTPFGFVTAYYEPEVPGSLEADPRYPAPLYGRPDDLVSWVSGPPPAGAPPNLVGARRTGNALVPYYTRGEIQAGALEGRGLEIAYVGDPIEAFFIHIQGSVRLRLEDGRRVRVGFAARNGHPYTAIGRILAERSGTAAKKITMDTVRGWLEKDLQRVHALLNENRSFVFFRLTEITDPGLGPPGAAQVQLTPGRSVAVDWRVHPYGVPVYVDTRTPESPGGKQAPYRRLMIAQDTGTAIVGPARLDLFIGSGDDAGRVAGNVRDAKPRVWLLRPKSGGL